MTRRDLHKILASGRVAAVARRQWEKLASSFAESESHETGVAGALKLGQIGEHLVAVEQAGNDLIAIRPLASGTAAADFVRRRLAAYDRIWDG